MDSCLNYVFSILYLLVTLDRINIGIGNIGSFPLNEYEEGMHCTFTFFFVLTAPILLPIEYSLPHSENLASKFPALRITRLLFLYLLF